MLYLSQYGKRATTEPMLSHPTRTLPWQFVSQDIFEFDHKQYLVTVDHFRDFYELDSLINTQSTTFVEITKAHFAHHGIPLRCLTDNGPQFISNEYKKFAQTYGFKHITLSPYWSRNNSKAEAAVHDAKFTLKKSHDVYLALFNMRNTPPCGYSFSPAQRLMGRRTCSSLPFSENLIKPEPADPLTVRSEITLRREASKSQYDKYAKPALLPLPLGSHAYAKPRPSQRGAPWLYGRIINSPSSRSYNIDTGNVILRRNRAQLRPVAPPRNIPLQSPPLPSFQPILPETPATPTAPTLHTPKQPPTAVSPQAQCLTPLPVMESLPQHPEQQTSESSTGPDPQTPDMQQTTRSGRPIQNPKKFDDFSLY